MGINVNYKLTNLFEPLQMAGRRNTETRSWGNFLLWRLYSLRSRYIVRQLLNVC